MKAKTSALHICPSISSSIEPIISKNKRIHPWVGPYKPCEFCKNWIKTGSCIGRSYCKFISVRGTLKVLHRQPFFACGNTVAPKLHAHVTEGILSAHTKFCSNRLKIRQWLEKYRWQPHRQLCPRTSNEVLFGSHIWSCGILSRPRSHPPLFTLSLAYMTSREDSDFMMKKVWKKLRLIFL